MASFSAGTTFTDGVANDVTAAKLAALVNAATPTSGLIQDRTEETTIAVNDTLLIGDASDSNNLKRMTVANFRAAATFGTTTSTAATITSGTITTLNSTTGTITTGVIPTLTSITKITSGTGTAAAPAISPTGNTNTGVFFPAADTIAFSEGGAESMRIDSSGNVGIGTTSPSTKLHISGAGTTSGSYTDGDADAQTLYLQDTGGAAGNGGQILFGASQGIFSGIKGHLDNGNGPAGSLLIQTRTTTGNVLERLRVNSSGNVGIGSTSPDARLEIEGTGSTASNPSTTSSIDTTIGLKSGLGSGNGGMLMFGSTAGYHVAIKGFATNNSSNTTGDLLFCTRTNATNTTLTEAMRIEETGNVGIGTASPTAKLDVNGSFSATSGTIPTLVSTTLITTGTGTAAAPAIVPTGDTNTGIFFPAADTIAFSEGGAEAMRINSSGQVGIGVTPTVTLDVNGPLQLRANGAEGGQIDFLNTGNASTGLSIDVSTADVGRVFSTRNNSILQLGQIVGTGGVVALYTAATERIRLDSSGNVSIGTATALSKLHVHGDLTLSNATTGTTASTSTITPPATVAGYLTVSINGTSRKIPYYAT